MTNYQPINVEPPLTIIRPTAGWVSIKLKDLWEYRELIYFLTWRDLKVRYKQTVLGIIWVILQPLLMTLVFGLLFARFAPLTSEGSDIPYPVFAFCGLLPWQFFAYVLVHSSNSLVASEKLLTKIYFPRLVIPLSGVLSGLVDFAVAFVFLLLIMAYYGIAPTSNLWAFPAFMVMVIVLAAGVGLWFSVLNLQYRDVRHIVPFISQLWFFISPVVYPISFIPERLHWLYAINPMVGALSGIRWSLLGSGSTFGSWLWLSGVVVTVIFFSGLYYFRHVEKDFADIV